MYKTISNEIIRKFQPCYDPSEVITDETEELTVKEWVEKYRSIVPAKDIIWLLSRREFLSEKDLRLFAVWCTREVLKLIENSDERIVEACNVAERYANGQATKEELLAVHHAAHDAADAVADAARAALYDDDAVNISASEAASYAAHEAAYAAYTATSYDAHDAAYAVAHNAYTAAFYTAYASYAVANAAYMAASSASEAAYYAYTASADVADAVSASQLNQLLTYFE
jgi:hypothetical protein